MRCSSHTPRTKAKKYLEVAPQARASLEQLASRSDGFARDVTALLPEQGSHPWAVLRKTQEGWWVITEVSDDEAMAAQRRALVLLWCAMAVALVVLAAGAAVTLKRGISAPLHELTQAITRIAQGISPTLSTARAGMRRWGADLIDPGGRAYASAMSTLLRQVNVAAHRHCQRQQPDCPRAMLDLRNAQENTAQKSARCAQSIEGKSPTACASLPMQHAKPTSCQRVRWTVASRGGQAGQQRGSHHGRHQ